MITNRKRTSLPILIIIAVLTALTLMVSGLLATASANTSATIESAKETLLVDDGSVDDVPSNVGASYSRVAESVAALDDLATYIVVLKDTPLASYRGGVAGLDAPALTDGKLDADSEASSNYLTYLSKRRDAVIESANAALSRDLNVSYEYGATLVGFAAEMTGHEAMQLEKLDGVLFVEKEKMSYPQTDAGPVWSGAADVWGGTWNSLSYKAEISGASEVPSVTTNVSGMGEFTYNFYTNELTYTINISNPDNVNLTAMHIHSATAGANGGVIYNFNIAPTNGDVSATGVVTLTTPGQEAALVNAALYVNIHSDVNTGGEARGQIELNGTLGEGVIVGILDTGVDPWNPSFLAVGGDGYVHTNPLGEGNYLGVCDPSNAGGSGVVAYDPTFPCNSKLIGVWGYTASDPSPRDGDGHGSHTASTAAGNVVFDSVAVAPTQVFTADISGVAPHANIIAYDVCIDGGGCPGASLAAARDQALLDGVDVINYSIGSSAPTGDFWADAESLQWLALRDAGVFVATSNGNSGNGDATTGSPADTPWITSVGANSHNRAFLVTVALSDGVSTVEVSGQAMTSGYGPAPIVFSSDYLSGTEDARLCAPGAFPPGTFSGEIVVCERGIYGRVDKGQAALDGGAGGFILAQPDEATGGPGAVAADTHVLPAAHIDYYQYQILRQFVITDSVAAVSGTLSGASLDVDDSHGDIMAAFSSRGPNGTDADLIVPKVTAPGRAIWAAYHQGPGGDGDYTYNVIQGTSMASPHAAGAGALLSAAHPDWSPAQMESALMLTARDTVLNDDGINIATPFAQGSGHIAVGMAAMSPLVMDVSTAEYVAAEPNDGDDFDVRDLNIASLGEDSCVAVCSWTRTVENVSSGTLTWTTSLTITAPATGTVQPATFTLAPGETQVITVSVDVSGNTPETDWVFGKVELDEDSGTYPDGHLPIAVYPASGNVPETLDIETQFTSGSVDLVDLLSIEITDLYTEATGMVFGELTTTSLPEDNDNGADFPDIFFDDVSTTFFYSITVPADSFSVIAEIADTTSPDLDMLLFLDDGNGIPELSDVGDPDTNPDACQSASGGSFEFCEILSPTPGTYFAAVINWSASAPPPAEDSLTLSTAVVPNGVDAGNLDLSGPAAVAPAEPFTLTVSYDEPTMTPGDKLYGAVSIGSDPGSPGNVGTIRVYLDYLGLPVFSVDPTTISETVQAGTTPSYTVTISNAGDGDLAWNMDDIVAGDELLLDGGFEAGRAGIWTTSSTLASILPICDVNCFGVNLARTGDWYALFGGSNASAFTTTAEQTVVIPSGNNAFFSFWMFIGAGINADADMTVSIDGNVLATYSEADAADFANYTQVLFDVSAYADDGPHTISFEYIKTAMGDGTNVNMFVDDVSVQSLPSGSSCNPVSSIPWLSANPASGTTDPASTTDVALTVDATALFAGTYTDTLCVITNDPINPFDTIDISVLVVGDPPTIVVDPMAITTTQSTNTSMTNTVTISNEGDVILNWDATQNLPPIDAVTDGSFEDGGAWDGGGDLGSPICDPVSCGAALARTGDWWAWFGGWGETNTSSITQVVTIPDVSNATLEFWLEINGNESDAGMLEVIIDGQTVMTYTIADDLNDFTSYAKASVDLSMYADGGMHELAIRGTEIGDTVSGFFVDDVALLTDDPTCKAVTDISWIDIVPSSGSVSAHSSEMVDVVFDATGVPSGSYTENVCISSNDPVNPVVTLTLTMEVYQTLYLPVISRP